MTDTNNNANFNTLVGWNAGLNNGTGNRNCFFGESAGFQNITGRRNTIIGSEANVGSGDLLNATAIGAGARVDQSNSVVLGDPTLFGIRVGIATPQPSVPLTLSGPAASRKN